MTTSATNTANQPLQPRIPEKFLDVPSQRLYILSLGLLCQAIKIFDWFHNLFSSNGSGNLALKWIVTDGLFFLVLNQLRIRRLHYSKAIVLLQIFAFWFMDGLMFGGIQIAMSHYSLSETMQSFYSLSTTGRIVNVRDVIAGDARLKGAHTVRISPVSTAKLNPNGLPFCLTPPSNIVLIPVLLNNTKPTNIRYTITSLGSRKVETIDLNTNSIKAIENSLEDILQLNEKTDSSVSDENEDDWDADDLDVGALGPPGTSQLYRREDLEDSQSITFIKVTKPGIVKLERVVDSSSSNEARVFRNEVLVVPCPTAQFADDNISRGHDLRCAGSSEQLSIQVFGFPPLSLTWHKEINGRRQHMAVDGIQDNKEAQGPERLEIPLSLSLDAFGTHLYMLDTVSDAAGNSISLTAGRKALDHNQPAIGYSNNAVTRSLTVLRTPSMSFRQCGPGHPTSLLIGAEAPLTISANEADTKDAPWEVTVAYQPPSGETGHKPWKKRLTTQGEKRELTVRATAPGDYSILNVKGRICPGDVLSPDSCRVLEQPRPTAEIEWKRIHECSGDTGVSAYLVLHGKPPFQVSYRQKRDNEAAKDMVRSFQGSRGEITLQPESSGNYTYTFESLSDANYKGITLNGPSINQVVHPPASAHFVGASSAIGHKSINSCSGSIVNVDVNLRGKGPWNLDVQIVGPKGSEIVHLSDIRKARETLRLPIPRIIDEEGGSFQVDLFSIEDAYGCKKELAVPGITVNVRRVKPTAKFFAKDGKRAVTVLEGDIAQLPLRMSGDGPWRVRYRRSQPPGPATTSIVNTLNDHLRVREKGLYELLEVEDSQCPGSVVENEATFVVDWIPRPIAKLWPGTEVLYESSNGSYIRAPVCEGQEDHVDLELTGRPPFQVNYNVARDGEFGGTKLLDQPTISSIQHRTRFQLHTSEAGRIYYEVKQIGDATYPIAQNAQHVLPRLERLLLEQEVRARPAAYFQSSSRLSYCLDDAFGTRDSLATEGMIIMEGKPPFLLQLSIKNLAASEVHHQTIEIWDSHWQIDLPNYTFQSIGPHLVTIDSVSDASRCEPVVADPLKQSIWVDVAETAAIVPFDRREHFCVGDVTQFQLEGIPPWTIGFKTNRKYHEQIAKQSPLDLVQQQPGNFSVTSISHQNKKCKAMVDNINFEVHALPSAEVAHGGNRLENIHEGGQAQITFTLIGEPPFTFTYQRAELAKRKGTGKVLETHTVSGVTNNEYSIYSALEGTWTVTFISDKYCRYPLAQSESIGERNKR
ncbi:hypothetical protein BD410DRAFT_782006 [Rickenella mellea]|uniref:Nucleoporin Pom152 n=1 Tax=Rickenella mellea TaxID=50990 RepID=A0A4Y7QK75_9AGAM|nr:hypothetical protein BD410DRAFT_782006 [Rickenella mellea]